MAPLSISSNSGTVRSSNGRVGKTGFLPYDENGPDSQLQELVRRFREIAGNLVIPLS